MLLDFYPISLFNVIYMIIVKIYINRPSLVLPSIISTTLDGFVKGRSILDNAMIGLDMHHIYRKTNLIMALKLDMGKAFNRVN